MPKESKRFINPLLRPTVEVETKREEAQTTQPEQPTSPAKTNTSTATSMETLTPPQTAEPPTPIPQPTELRPSTKRLIAHPSTDTSAFQEKTDLSSKPQMREPLRSESEAAVDIPQTEASERESVMLYTTSPVTPGYRNDQATALKRGMLVDQPLPPTTMPSSETQPFPSTSHSGEFSAPTISRNTPSMPMTSTYTSTEPNISSVSVQDDEVVEQERYTAPPPSRRRRGEQAFEKTHERITLWIDKRLKQAFEELAYEQEISKTALLNEAMADLLNKYTSR